MPTPSPGRVSVAWPLTSGTWATATPSGRKGTVPCGVLDPGAWPVTVAVMVTGSRDWTVGAEAVSSVVVAGGWNSTAPTSTVLLTTRLKPRWSNNAPAGTAPLTPASMTGLPGSGASVSVGPPLFCKGPSSGLSGLAAVPRWLAVRAPSPPLLMPTKSPVPDTFVVLMSGSVPPNFGAPLLAKSPATMLLLSVNEPTKTSMPPPKPVEMLPVMVQLLMVVTGPSAKMAPPSELPTKVLLTTTRVPWPVSDPEPPPGPFTKLPRMLLWAMVTTPLPALPMPPPMLMSTMATLSLTVVPVTVRLALWKSAPTWMASSQMPPPW